MRDTDEAEVLSHIDHVNSRKQGKLIISASCSICNEMDGIIAEVSYTDVTVYLMLQKGDMFSDEF